MPRRRDKRRGAVKPIPPTAAATAVPSQGRNTRSWWTTAAAVTLVVLTLSVFAPVRHFDFVEMDDPSYVFENSQVLGGLTPHSVTWAFTTGHAGYWMPAVWLSYMIDVEVFGQGPHGHHVTNLLLHVAATLLLFTWLARATASLWRSAVVAALFAVHPLHVESVAWITERKDVLSAVFWMLTLWAYLGYVRRPGWRRYAIVTVTFVAGLMSKAMVVTLPLVLLMADVWPLGRLRIGRAGTASPAERPFRALLWEKLPLVLLALCAAIVTFLAQLRQGAVGDLATLGPGLRIGNALVSYAEYIRMTVWPVGLSFFYPMPESIPGWTIAGSVVLLAGVTAAVIVRWRRWPWLAVGWFWYLATLLPVIGLVQVGEQARADRFMYLPVIGLFVMAVWGAAEIVPRRRWRPILLAGVSTSVVTAFGVTARAQVWHWQDSVSLYTHASMVELHQDEYSAHMQLGVAFRGKGRLDEAVVHFTRAVQLEPEAADPHVELGLTFTAKGQVDAAIAHYRDAIRLQAGRADAHNNLGAVFTEQGRFDEAIRELREAVRIDPNLEAAHVNLGLAFVKADRVAESIPEFREVLRINPNNELAKRAVSGLTRR